MTISSNNLSDALRGSGSPEVIMTVQSRLHEGAERFAQMTSKLNGKQAEKAQAVHRTFVLAQSIVQQLASGVR